MADQASSRGGDDERCEQSTGDSGCSPCVRPSVVARDMLNLDPCNYSGPLPRKKERPDSVELSRWLTECCIFEEGRSWWARGLFNLWADHATALGVKVGTPRTFRAELRQRGVGWAFGPGPGRRTRWHHGITPKDSLTLVQTDRYTAGLEAPTGPLRSDPFADDDDGGE